MPLNHNIIGDLVAYIYYIHKLKIFHIFLQSFSIGLIVYTAYIKRTAKIFELR